MKIRIPNTTDYTAIALLLTHLGYANTTKDVQERYKILNKQKDYYSLVCTIEGIVVGYIAYTHNYYFEQSGTYIRVLALAVHPDFKRKQIGTALIAKVEEDGRRLGAKMVLLNCGNKKERKAAHIFYPKIGFSAISVGYVKKL